jgi:hypothetical protein
MSEKKPTKKQAPKKKAAAKKQPAKKSAAKKPVAKKPAAKKPSKPRSTTSTTVVTAAYDAVLTTPEVQEKIEFVSDKVNEAKDIAQDMSSLIRMNDVKSAKIRKKMIAWFRKK